jgi:DNA-binding winged helix-turn-helix (wHTH) protein/tetratricopeptide (TPR) repeat protein
VIYAFGDFELDLAALELRHGGRPIPLQPKAFDVLAYLVRRRDRPVPKDELLDALWPGEPASEASLTRAVSALRRALGEAGRRAVATERGRGYRFAAPVEERSALSLRGAEASPGPLVGRAPALAEIDLAFDALEEGRGGLVLLAGEAGIGKSRLAAEAAARARARGALVLVGRCPEEAGAPALRPFAQILRGYAEGRDPRALAAVFGPGAEDLVLAVPELRRVLPALAVSSVEASASARVRLFDAMRSFLRSASAARPLLLVVDDLHRADELSLRLLAFLAPHLAGMPVLVLGAYRDTLLERDPQRGPLLAGLAAAARTVRLAGLEIHAVEALYREVVGADPPRGRGEELAARTGGNPFFLVQLLRLLRGARGAPEAEALLPRGVRDAILRQLAGVSPACRELLVQGAVVGREFSTRVVADAGGTRPEAAREALAEAVAAHALVPAAGSEDAFAFAHILVRDALYEGLAPAERAARHGRVAAALGRAPLADPDEHAAALAHHYLEAAPGGDVEAAAVHALRAAERATARLAWEEACAWYERVLDLLELRAEPDLPRRGEVLAALGESRMRVFEASVGGSPEGARDALARAARLGKSLAAPDLLARAALAFGGTEDLAGQVLVLDAEHVTLLEEALAAVGDARPALRVRLLERCAKALYWADATERRAELSREAEAAALRAGDTASRARAAYSRRWGLRVPEELDRELPSAIETVRLAQAAGDSGLLLAGSAWLVHAQLAAGDVQAALAAIDEYTRLANALRIRIYPAFFFRASVEILQGRFEEGERLGREGLAAAQGTPWAADAGMSFGTQLALIRTEQGRTAEVEPMLRLFVDRYPQFPGWRAGLAALLCEDGRLAEAREHFEILARQRFDDVPRDFNWTHNMVSLAETCAHLGDAERAAWLHARLLPRAHAAAVVGYASGCWGSVSRWLGLLAATLGRPGEAARHYEAALERNQAQGARSWLARTQLDFARLLHAQGGPGEAARARHLAAAALDTADALGLRVVSERARGLLTALAA